MDSRPWLLGLGALAALLAALLAIDLLRAPAPATAARVFPDWDPRAVRSIRLERPRRPSVVLEREPAPDGRARASADAPSPAPAPPAPSPPASPADPASGWVMRVPASGAAALPVDPAALRGLLGTLETLSAIRRDAGAVDAPGLTLVIERAPAPSLRLLVASAAPGPTDRVWMTVSGQRGRFLVDGYAARALDLTADDLRDRRPFRGRPGAASRIDITAGDRTAVLLGPPWRIQVSGASARAAPARVEALLDALQRLRLSRFVDPSAAAPTLRLAVTTPSGRTEIAIRGTCPGGETLVETPIGTGCAPLDPVGPTLADPDSWVERALLGAPVDQVARLRLTRAGRSIDVTRADAPDALRDWLTRWSAAAAGPIVPADRLAAPIAQLDLDLDGAHRDEVAIAPIRGTRSLAALRPGEPVALVLHPWADSHLDPSPHHFRSLDLLSVEPTSLRAATSRRGPAILESIERGDTLEEWRALVPAGSIVSSAALDALRQSISFLRAERFVAPSASPRHGLAPPRRTVELSFDPDPGAADPVRHTLDIGAPAGPRCYARLDRDPTIFELSAPRCRALLGPWTVSARRR